MSSDSPIKKIGDICKVFSGGTPRRGIEGYYGGDVPWAKIGDIENAEGGYLFTTKESITQDGLKSINNKIFKKDTIFLALYGSVGKTAIAGREMSTNQAILGLIPKNPEVLYFKYLKYWLDYSKSELIGLARGVALQNISATIVKEYPIPLPPIEEQHRIVKILDLAQALIEKRKHAISYLDDYIKSVFLDMFGDPVSNPKGWEVKTIEQIAVKDKNGIKAGPFGSSLKKEFYVKSGYKIYGQEQVIKNDLSFGDYYIDENRYKSLSSCKIQSGDILISLVGSFGKISIVPDKFEPGIINPRLMKITPDQKIISPIFLKELLVSNSVQSQIRKVSHGGTMGIVNVGIMKKIKILVPPLQQQLNYLKVVTETESLKQKMQSQLKELEDNFQAQLRRAFRGE